MATNVRQQADLADLREHPDFETLYGQYHQFIRRALRKHYVDTNELDDVTQEVFLVLLRRMDEVSVTGSLAAWLFQIARRVAANHHRRARRRARKHDALEVEHTSDTIGPRLDDPERYYARQQALDLIRDFLESLDEEACAVFVMAEIEGLRGADIAARLGLTLPMTYARIRAVRARFNRRVAKERGLLATVFVPLKQTAVAVGTLVMALGLRAKVVLTVLGVGLVALLAARPWSGSGPGSPGSDVSPWVSARSDGQPETAGEPGVVSAGHGGIYTGVVVDPQGAPVEGASVCADREWNTDHFLTEPPTCETTDAAGRFRVRGARWHLHTVEASAHGFTPGHFRGRPGDGVRIVLHPGGVPLSGVVADVYGGPIEGAWVSVENRAHTTLGTMVRSDADGKFSLWVSEGPISLGAGAAGYATAFTMAVAPSKEVRVELGAESVIAGVVVDGETGSPMSGVRVSAELHPTLDKYTNRQGVTFSDADGNWEIRSLQPNHYVIDAATHEAWGRARQGVDLGLGDYRGGIRIEMLQGVRIEGRIVDEETGEPCAEGSAVTMDDAQSISRGEFVGEDGMVSVPSLTGGVVYPITVSCVGHLSRVFEVDLRAGPPELQTWSLARGAELAVQLTGPDESPLRGWTVEARGEDSMQSGTSDDDGVATLVGLSPAAYKVVAHGPGFPEVSADVEVGPGRTEAQLSAPGGATVTGTVRRDTGEPASGGLVVLRSTNVVNGPPGPGIALPPAPSQAITDAGGRFSLTAAGAGEYGVWFVPRGTATAYTMPENVRGVPNMRPGMPSEPLQVVTVADEPISLDIVVSGVRSISGIVRDEQGDLVENARVFAAREQPGGRPGPRGTPQVSDREGRYRFDEVLEGRYVIVAYRPGGGVVRRAGVEAGSSSADLMFPRTGGISGHVRDQNGAPVKAYRLSVHGKTGLARPFTSVGSVDGAFVVDRIPTGRQVVRVEAPQGGAETAVEVQPDQWHDGVELIIAAHASVKGQLVDESGAPGWHVALVDPTQREFLLILPVIEDGSFKFPRLPARELLLKAVPHDILAKAAPPDSGGSGLPDVIAGLPTLRAVTPTPGQEIDLGTLVPPEANAGE